MNQVEYTHANYRDLLKDAEIYNGKNKCYFCPDCKRYVPKNDCSQPCPFCGSINWKLDNPLVNEIINTKKLQQYMFETYKTCIEPFTNFEMQQLKNGKLFHRISSEIIKINTEDVLFHFTNMELWCVSFQSVTGWFLSFCLKWNEIHTHQNMEEKSRNPKVKFLTIKVNYKDRGGDFDDEFYFNLTWETLLKEGYYINQLWYDGVDYHSEKKKKICLQILSCCEAMNIHNDKFSGYLYPQQLKGAFSDLITALSDFTLIPLYWGYGA